MAKCVKYFFYILVLSFELANPKDIHFLNADVEPVVQINHYYIINQLAKLKFLL